MAPPPDKAGAGQIDYAALRGSDPGDRLDALDLALLTDDANHIAPALPRSAEERDKFSMQSQRGQFVVALVDRLRRLGYLPGGNADILTLAARTNTHNSLLDPIFILAVKQLQREAGVMVDGWPGPQTWDALQGLYCFEGAKAELGRRRKRARQDDLAVLRACLLRLDSLGLCQDQPGETRMDAVVQLHIHAVSDAAGTGALADAEIRQRLTNAITPALRRFRGQLRALGLQEAERDDAGLRGLLLDYDRLASRLARVDTATLTEDRLAAAEGFICQVLTIEMWLLGFKSNEKRLPMVSLLPADVEGVSARDALAGAIKHFLNFMWDQKHDSRGAPGPVTALMSGYGARSSDRPGGPIARNLRQNFPVILQAIELATHAPGADRQLNQDLVDKMSMRPTFRKALEEAVQTERSRLWDGIRRMIGWVFRFFKRIVSRIAEFAQKVVRVVFAFSAEAINAVRDGLGIIRTGLEHMLKPSFLGPNEAMLGRRDFDFDYQIVMDRDRPDAAAQDGRFLELRARAMAIASRLISALFKMLRELRSGLLTGWVGIGIALLRVSRDARALARWVGEVRDLSYEFDKFKLRVI